MDKKLPEDRIREITVELEELEQRKQILLSELKAISRERRAEQPEQFLGKQVARKVPETPEEKIELFITLFCCRRDLYPHYWENKRSGKKGYSPVCSNEWKQGLCLKPKIKCTSCSHQAFLPFDEKPVKDHLTGKIAMGSYAIAQNDTCIFLAADFDKSTWREDVSAYREAASEIAVQVAVEISKSGNGAHGWIFFDAPVSARKARLLGELIKSNAMDRQGTFSLDSYDRFFPNQDCIPSGGFGNLIALPLQKAYRDRGFSLFLDRDLAVIPDQWDYLSKIRRIGEDDLNVILQEKGDSAYRIDTNDEMTVAESIMKGTGKGIADVPVEPCTGVIKMRLKGEIEIPLADLPSRIVIILKKLATFANPKYFEAQRMRFSTWNIPKYIFCGDNDDQYIYLPRGLEKEVEKALTIAGFTVKKDDLRNRNEHLELGFSGDLFEYQLSAVEQMDKTEHGVLVAPTGTGKTIMALYLLAKRGCRTLILVHRSTLIEQWINALCTFIPEIDKKDIGVLGGGRRELKGKIDIAMLQSLAHLDELENKTAGYDFLIVDECHRVPTVTFEPVLKRIQARRVLGLTATPQRKDRFESIIFMQCGPIAYTVKDVNRQNQDRNVFFRSTTLPDLGTQSSVQHLWNYLCTSEERNLQILSDIVELLSNNRSPLVLSDRTEHLDTLVTLLGRMSDAVIHVMKGSIGKKERKAIMASIEENISNNTPFCLFSTGSLVGEGFDIPELDTMVITMPISFKGRLTQYIGRLHRQGRSRMKEIIVYDYVDTCSGMTISMFKKRISAYKKLGYTFHYDPADRIARWL